MANATQSTAECAVYTVKEVAKILGISKTHAFKLINEGIIPRIRLGRRIVIRKREFDTWLESYSS